MNVLLVEDNSESRDCLDILLTLRDCEVKSCKSVTEALEALRAGFAPDRVLLDYYLPGADGVTFLRFLREWHGCGTVPVYMLTAADSDKVTALELETADLGPMRVLRKPLDPRVLMELVTGGEMTA